MNDIHYGRPINKSTDYYYRSTIKFSIPGKVDIIIAEVGSMRSQTC